jgi:hypothetical protein
LVAVSRACAAPRSSEAIKSCESWAEVSVLAAVSRVCARLAAPKRSRAARAGLEVSVSVAVSRVCTAPRSSEALKSCESWGGSLGFGCGFAGVHRASQLRSAQELRELGWKSRFWLRFRGCAPCLAAPKRSRTARARLAVSVLDAVARACMAVQLREFQGSYPGVLAAPKRSRAARAPW